MTCPSCGKTLDANTGLFGANSPTPGSVSICIYCAGLHFFTEGGLRKPTAQEHEALMEDAGVRQAQLAVQQHLQDRARLGGKTRVVELDKNEVSRVCHALVKFFKDERIGRQYGVAAMEFLVDIMRKETGERTVVLKTSEPLKN